MNETHVMSDGSEHDARFCPDDCSVRAGLERLLAALDAGTMTITRVS